MVKKSISRSSSRETQGVTQLGRVITCVGWLSPSEQRPKFTFKVLWRSRRIRPHQVSLPCQDAARTIPKRLQSRCQIDGSSIATHRRSKMAPSPFCVRTKEDEEDVEHQGDEAPFVEQEVCRVNYVPVGDDRGEEIPSPAEAVEVRRWMRPHSLQNLTLVVMGETVQEVQRPWGEHPAPRRLREDLVVEKVCHVSSSDSPYINGGPFHRFGPMAKVKGWHKRRQFWHSHSKL